MRYHKLIGLFLILAVVFASVGLNSTFQSSGKIQFSIMGMNSIGAGWMDLLKSYEVIGSLIAGELVMTSGRSTRIKFRNLRANGESDD